MQETAIVIVVLVFLPFIVSLTGSNPVWKFLALLFCIFAAAGAFALIVPGVMCWIIAWIFAGASVGSRRSPVVVYPQQAAPTFPSERAQVPAVRRSRALRAVAIIGSLSVGILVAGTSIWSARDASSHSTMAAKFTPDAVVTATSGKQTEVAARASAAAVPAPSPAAQLREAKASVEISEFKWRKGGFDNIMLATFTLNNKSRFNVKDITVRCEHAAPSGTTIDSNRGTIYEVVKAKSKKTVREFNMGFIHSQARSSGCVVQDLVLAEG
jgi:hypothetical protein